ncbi:hypothetical protein M8A51_12055 [Schlegelella sp. S2-27]|uniref:Uncharacterized protein n=1 Tax=Caldimonas mangrovi TaxID=2944811 RepID=A0ABT0YNM7_9BURK|nr:hypothetical protein [Caldimonas mangrovi]MCM5680263.1 hypothetical protein [Caldimonas mangrovi]
MNRCIALAGAPGTGVEFLQAGLAARLADAGTPARLVDITPWLLGHADSRAPEADRLCCLLAGVDAATGVDRRAAETIDAQLRLALGAASWPYSVVYGRVEQRVDTAWRLLQPRLFASVSRLATVADTVPQRLRPCCLECLVPECEHRLFRFASKP